MTRVEATEFLLAACLPDFAADAQHDDDTEWSEAQHEKSKEWRFNLVKQFFDGDTRETVQPSVDGKKRYYARLNEAIVVLFGPSTSN